MNKALVIAMAALAPRLALAQGTFNFNNVYVAAGVLPGGSAPIYYSTHIDGSSPVLADNNFYVTVLGGPVTGAVGVGPGGLGNLWPLRMAAAGSTNVLKTFRTGANLGFISGGGTVFYQAASPGTTIAVQVVAWYKWEGADLEAAFASGGPAPGFSAVMQITLGAPSDPNQPRLAAFDGVADPTKCSTPGLSSFTIVPFPEPSVLALGGLGLAGAFLLRHRR